MKIINLILVSVLSLSAMPSFAGGIPATASLEATLTSTHNGPYSVDYLKQINTTDLKTQIANQETAANHEFHCANVYYEWSSVSHDDSDCSAAAWLTGRGDQCYHYVTTTVNVYCEARDYAQKIAISAEKSCESEPKPECLSKPYMDLFAGIKATKYFNIDKDNSNSGSDN